MLPIFSISTLFILDGITIYFFFFDIEFDIFALFLAFLLLHSVYAAVIIRFLIIFFPIKEGKFSTSSPEFFRWQAQALIYTLSAIYLEPFIPFIFKAPFYRFYGAKIGKGVSIGGKLVDISLTYLDHHSVIGADAMVLCHLITNDVAYIGKVILEENAMVGAKSLISPGVIIKKGATVGAMSLVTSGKKVPEKEIWVGNPAKLLKKQL